MALWLNYTWYGQKFVDTGFSLSGAVGFNFSSSLRETSYWTDSQSLKFWMFCQFPPRENIYSQVNQIKRIFKSCWVFLSSCSGAVGNKTRRWMKMINVKKNVEKKRLSFKICDEMDKSLIALEWRMEGKRLATSFCTKLLFLKRWSREDDTKQMWQMNNLLIVCPTTDQKLLERSAARGLKEAGLHWIQKYGMKMCENRDYPGLNVIVDWFCRKDHKQWKHLAFHLIYFLQRKV